MHLARVILAAVFAGLPAIGGAAQLLVLNKNDATLVFVDPASGKIAATVATGRGPHEVEVSRNGGISIIDTDSGKVVRTVNAGTQRSNRVKITPDGRYALVSDLAAGNLLIFDAHDYREAVSGANR